MLLTDGEKSLPISMCPHSFRDNTVAVFFSVFFLFSCLPYLVIKDEYNTAM